MSWPKKQHEGFFASKPPGFKIAYYRYNAIMARCRNPKAINYRRYGGRGIELRVERYYFIRWFLRKSKGDFSLEVDRRRNDGHYEIGNMRLVTHKENVRSAYRQVAIIAEVGLRNIRSANKKREIRVRIGAMEFASINEAGRYFGCKAHVRTRIKKYGSVMADGTPIEVII